MIYVRFLKELPAYRDADDEQQPPRQAGEVALMKRVEAEWLFKGSLAEPITPEVMLEG